ncbi:hypothetical protein PPROV_000681700 [Pycnococcus provasolii]|uniref:Anaphase-promoting complex subunit 4 WD40 domain-containing protein n=3 Tax=Pycnococcus provasolii TaxID=41880 RepID=A0A830HN71_9CHLO|nr:hypothetical protein PPROV_000681700 [Pycnococcus provasolii]
MKLRLCSRKEAAHADAVWACTSTSTGCILTGSLDETVKSWNVAASGSDAASLEEAHVYSGHGLGVVSLASSPSSSASDTSAPLCVSNALDSSIRVWDIASHANIKTFNTPPGESWGVAMHPDNRHVYAAGGSTGALHIYDLTAPAGSENGIRMDKPVASVPLPKPGAAVLTSERKRQHYAMAVAVSPSASRVACSAADGIVALYDTQANGGVPTLIATCEGHASPVRALCFVDNGRLLATASDDTHVHLYDAKTGALVEAMAGHDGWAVSVSADNADGGDSRYVLSTGTDGAVKLWDTDARACVQTLKDSRGALWDACFVRTNDSRRFVAAVGEGKEVLLYEASTE